MLCMWKRKTIHYLPKMHICKIICNFLHIQLYEKRPPFCKQRRSMLQYAQISIVNSKGAYDFCILCCCILMYYKFC